MVVAARLRRTTDIDRARAEGKARSDRLFTLRALATGAGTVRVAVSAQRATGSSVGRNRARRRLREALRLELRERGAVAPADLVLSARPAAATATTAELRAAIARQLDALAIENGRARERGRPVA